MRTTPSKILEHSHKCTWRDLGLFCDCHGSTFINMHAADNENSSASIVTWQTVNSRLLTKRCKNQDQK